MLGWHLFIRETQQKELREHLGLYKGSLAHMFLKRNLKRH